MQKTKQEIFDAMKADIKKRHHASKKPAPKPAEKDTFAGLIANLKNKQNEKGQ